MPAINGPFMSSNNLSTQITAYGTSKIPLNPYPPLAQNTSTQFSLQTFTSKSIKTHHPLSISIPPTTHSLKRTKLKFVHQTPHSLRGIPFGSKFSHQKNQKLLLMGISFLLSKR